MVSQRMVFRVVKFTVTGVEAGVLCERDTLQRASFVAQQYNERASELNSQIRCGVTPVMIV